MFSDRLFATLAYVAAASATLYNLDTSASIGKQVLNGNQFEYIIVGGGTTGLTLARRLSEDQSKRILVLEAGRSGVADPLVTIPQKSFSFIATDIDWLYFTTPQSHGAGQEINLSSGKVLGGDSAVNGLAWNRPHKSDYDDFEKLGSRGWNWNNLFASSRNSEKVNIPERRFVEEFGYTVNPASHGNNGPVDSAFPPFFPLQHLKFINASIELGHQFNVDPYRGDNVGVWFGLSSQTARSVRESAEFAYLDPILQRSNLFIFSHAVVTKVDIASGSSGNVKSTGVRVRFPDGSLSLAKVKNSGEVILTAGSVRTPQLLELSGIGDKRILERLRIPVKVDLPGVGENYEDHTITILTYKLKPGFLSFDALEYNETLRNEQQVLYDTKREGWFTFANGVFNMAPASTILTPKELKTAADLLKQKPDGIAQDQFELVKRKVFGGVPQAEFLLFNSFSGGVTKLPNTSYVSMAITHLHPLSRGSIHINTTSIDDHPVIDPNVLASQWDAFFLAKATAYGRKFFETPSFREIFDPVEIFPGPQVSTDAQWERFIRDNINIGYHSIGTASLLPRSKKGVVDPNLKVYGTNNIRVADVSIMPLHVSAHTQTSAYAIAERAAELIKLA